MLPTRKIMAACLKNNNNDIKVEHTRFGLYTELEILRSCEVSSDIVPFQYLISVISKAVSDANWNKSVFAPAGNFKMYNDFNRLKHLP